MKRKRNLKLPNGFGSIVYLGDNRRKPYGARVTNGWTDNGVQKFKYVGYAVSWNEAYKLLVSYNETPYNLDSKDIKLGEVYNILEPMMKSEIGNKGMSLSNYKNLTSAYNNYLEPLKNLKMLDIKKKQLKEIISKSGLKHTGRGYIKNIWTRIVTYCIDELELKLDLSIVAIDIGQKEKSNKHVPLNENEIHLIDDLAPTNDTAKMIMIYLYTGLRPSELLLIEKNNVFLSDDYMIGGIKTEAGQNRAILIHSNVKKYIEYFYSKSTCNFLIMNELTGKNMSYDCYQERFEKMMTLLSLKHIPGDTRTTFATKCDSVGIPLPIIKRLMGHSLAGDVTNDVYIRKSIEDLKDWVERIEY